MKKAIFLLILIFAVLFKGLIFAEIKIKELEQKVDELNYILKCQKR